jgi:hypothetical protein
MGIITDPSSTDGLQVPGQGRAGVDLEVKLRTAVFLFQWFCWKLTDLCKTLFLMDRLFTFLSLT